MPRGNSFDSSQIMYRVDELMKVAENRYEITVKVARRSKRIRYDDFEDWETPTTVPVIRAIVEVSDELTQPEILSHSHMRKS